VLEQRGDTVRDIVSFKKEKRRSYIKVSESDENRKGNNNKIFIDELKSSSGEDQG